MGKLMVGILWATGAAGLEFVRALDWHPWFQIAGLYASEKSAGKSLEEACSLDTANVSGDVRAMILHPLAEITADLDLICSALPSDVAKAIEAQCAQHTPVISTASAFRYEPDVPILITEINPEHYHLLETQQIRGWDGWIAPGPNCTTVGLVMSLAPIYREVGIKRVVMSSYQAVSGGGSSLLQLWSDQRRELVSGDRLNLPNPLAGLDVPVINPDRALEGNVIGCIEGEERKVKRETMKILGELNGNRVYNANFLVDCYCVRVPVLQGHFETVFVETKDSCSPDDLIKIYAAFNEQATRRFGSLPSSPKETIVVLDRAPQPFYDVNLHGGMAAVVGRIKRGESQNWIKYQVLSNNTQRGAAKGMVQVAEYLHKTGFLKAK